MTVYPYSHNVNVQGSSYLEATKKQLVVLFHGGFLGCICYTTLLLSSPILCKCDSIRKPKGLIVFTVFMSRMSVTIKM